MMILVVVRFVVEVIADVVGHAVADLATALLSYECRTLELRSPESSVAIFKNLRAEGQVDAHPRSGPEGLSLIIRDATPHSIHIQSQAFMGPAFRGELDTNEDGCVVRGRLTLGTGARWAYAFVVIGIVTTAILGVTVSPMGCASLGVVAILALVSATVAALRVAHHKRQTVPAFITHLTHCVSGPEDGK